MPTVIDGAALTAVCFARATQEAELRIVDLRVAEVEKLMMMMMLLVITVVMLILVILFDFAVKFGSRFGRAEHKLDPSRVESIHKRSLFGLDTTTNR